MVLCGGDWWNFTYHQPHPQPLSSITTLHQEEDFLISTQGMYIFNLSSSFFPMPPKKFTLKEKKVEHEPEKKEKKEKEKKKVTKTRICW